MLNKCMTMLLPLSLNNKAVFLRVLHRLPKVRLQAQVRSDHQEEEDLQYPVAEGQDHTKLDQNPKAKRKLVMPHLWCIKAKFHHSLLIMYQEQEVMHGLEPMAY